MQRARRPHGVHKRTGDSSALSQQPVPEALQRFRAYVLKEHLAHAWTYCSEQGIRDFLFRWRKSLN